MAKFCRFCGKELAEGMNCDCPQSQEQYIPVAPQPAQANNIDIKGEALNVWQILKTMFKKPESTSANLTKTSDAKQAMILIGVQSLLTAILMCVMAGQINGLFEMGGKMADSMKYSIIGVFVVSFICSAAMAAAVAGILMCIVKLFKGNATYQQTLCISSANSIVLMPFIAVAVVYGLLFGIDAKDLTSAKSAIDAIKNFFLPFLISTVGFPLGLLIMKSVLKELNLVEKEKAAYVIFITFIISAVVLYLVVSIGSSLCEPEAISKMGGFTKMLDF